jgi:hypothetical protein
MAWHSGIEFHLSHGDWIRLLRRSGFEIDDLVELRPPVGATSRYSLAQKSQVQARYPGVYNIKPNQLPSSAKEK